MHIFVPSIQKFVDKDERELNNLDNIDNIFIRPVLFNSKDDIEMKDETKKINNIDNLKITKQ